MLYSLPNNSFTLVNDKENKIYLVKLVSSKKNTFSEKDENYLNFVKTKIPILEKLFFNLTINYLKPNIKFN